MKIRPSQRKILICLFLLAWVALAIIISQLIIGYPMFWILGKENFKSPISVAIFSTLSYILALFITIFIPWKISQKYRTTREELGLLGLPTWTDIGLTPIGFTVALILALIFTSIFSFFPWFNPTEIQNIGFNTYLNSGDRIIALLTLAIIAPITEEIIFRGWLYGKLRSRFAMPISIILVSLLFGIVHFQWNVGIHVFAMSIILCGLREFTGTIYAGILMHMLKNAIAFYCLFILGIS